MQNKRLRIAVFGVGRWGAHLVRIFLAHPQVQLVAVVDPSRSQLSQLQQRVSLEESVLVTTDWEWAMRSPDWAAVAIATPAATHYPLIRAALMQKLHVFAEKPLALSVVEAEELCLLAAQQQCQLVVDHTYLFHPVVERGKPFVQRGLLGELRYGYAARTHLGPVRQDVDALWDLAIHDIGIFNHWLGAMPCQVQAQGTVWLQREVGDRTFFPSGLSDLVWVKLIYPSGFQALIHLCWANADKQRRLCVVGSHGTLVFDELAPAPLVFLQGKLQPISQQWSPTKQAQQILEVKRSEPLANACEHFVECALNRQLSRVSSGLQGLQLVKILAALTRSQHQAGAVVPLEW